MIYLDSSVLVAHLLSEDRKPPASLWDGPLVSSRLLEVEAWTALHARGKAGLGGRLSLLLARLSVLEMEEEVLERATRPFQMPVRALDAIHLATAEYLRELGEHVSIATYDGRMAAVAREMDFETIPLD
ncbi:MAG TPA: PIN domain-containing protein [Gemmatimonadota bacterium]|nr:PIN domain-containing protein [Gemmatimonadota bacterium]